MKPESNSAQSLDQNSTALPTWMGDGKYLPLSEKDFPSEAEFLRAESRRATVGLQAARKRHPLPF